MTQFMTDYDQINTWLKDHGIGNYTVNPIDSVVDVNDNVDLGVHGLTYFPLQFGKIAGYFNCGNNNLDSLVGCPRIATGFNCSVNNFNSLAGIHTHINYVDRFVCDRHVTNILGLMIIKGIRHVNIDNGPIDRILNSHLQGNRDIHQCQEELIEAGFAAQAKL